MTFMLFANDKTASAQIKSDTGRWVIHQHQLKFEDSPKEIETADLLIMAKQMCYNTQDQNMCIKMTETEECQWGKSSKYRTGKMEIWFAMG